MKLREDIMTTSPSPDTNTLKPHRESANVWMQPVLLAAVAGSFMLGVYLGRTTTPQLALPPAGISNAEFGKPGDVDASVLWEVWQRVEAKHVDRAKIDRQQLIYGAAEGLVRALKDPYSVFLPPEDAKRFEDDVRGAFEGIGAEIGIRKDVLTVIAPLEGTPAKAAGLLAGDKILKIDDTITADLTLEGAVDRIRGPRGTEVALLIARDGLERTKEIKIRREVIKVPVLAWEIVGKSKRSGGSPTDEGAKTTEDKDGNIAWVRMFHFSDTLRTEFRRVAREIEGRHVRGIVLDLRNNPGGFLEVASDISGWFLEPDALVAVEDFGDGRKQEYRTTGPALFKNLPMVVLINGGSASASEIVAGALRDGRGIKLVGERSFGKGSVQELETLRNGASIKITVAKWVTPKGTILQEKGLDPDVIVELNENDIKNNRDPQLEKALEILRENFQPRTQ